MRGIWWIYSFALTATEAVVRGIHHEAEAWLAPQNPLRGVQCDFEASLPGTASNLEIDVGLTEFQCSISDDNSLGKSLHREERLTWLTRSKIAAAGSNCISYTPNITAGWNYQLCLGREIAVHRGSKSTAIPGITLFSFGFHEPEQDEHFINGSLVQYYMGGTSGRSSRVLFTCSETLMQVSNAEISKDGLDASFEISAPQFCDWRRGADTRPPLDRLLAEDIGRCFNLTLNYWTYEYCHPDSLTQFHLEPNGNVVTPMFLMGGLRSMGSSDASDDTVSGILWPAASPSFPIIRSVFEPSKQGIPATTVTKWRQRLVQKFRNLPMEVIAMPLWVVHLLNMPSTNRALGFYLGKGSPCPEIPGGLRSTRVIFVCPSWMQLGSGTRLVAIREIRTCEYELIVEAVGICAHPALRPAVPEIPKIATCERRRQSKPASRLDHLAFSPRAINLVARFVREEISMEEFAESLWVPETAAVNALRRAG